MKLSVKQLVAAGIGAAVFFVLARFLSIPIFANTNLTLQYAALGFFAAVFGPVVGLLAGLIGHAVSDLTSYGLWWSWIIPSGVVGFASGFLFKNVFVLKAVNIEEGEFDIGAAIQFIIGSLVIHLLAWGVLAPVLDILIYAEPANKVFAQGIIAGITNFIFTAIVGTLLLFAYSKTRTKTGSLTKG
jgi:energy-coupling factor transport system substrate-specific component